VSEERDLLDEVQRLIAELESHPDPEVGARVMALLQGIDAIHRTALGHLVAAIQGMAGEAFLNRLSGDPAIRLLLMSYDLLAVDRRLHAEEALDTVRGHLHGHGIDVELSDVIGGAVYVKLHGLERSAVAIEAVRHDLEHALTAGLLGFQELVIGDRAAARPATLLQVGGLRAAQRPIYRRVCATTDVAPGTVKAVDVDGHGLLIANVEGTFHAVANQCGDSPLPLQFSTLDGAELRCSWHGCRYDVRSGQRCDGPERLAVFPVAVEGDEVRVAVGVEPVARA
jgi:nitrite reductase/ring-hydroxylating ferredoxin subunit